MAMVTTLQTLFTEVFNMKNISLKLLKVAVFLTLLVFILYNVNKVLLPKSYAGNSKWPASTTINQFYAMEENTVDVLFLGSSVVANDFSPQQLYDDLGIRSYNLATSGQSIFFNYYMLKEALQYQSPSAVVIDSKFLFNSHPSSAVNATEATTREVIDNMKWGPVKMELINDLCERDETQDKLSYYLTNIRYHGIWTDLDQSNFDYVLTDHDYLKGHAVIYDEGDSSYTPFEPSDSTAFADLDPVMASYFGQIASLCKENDIDLMLISLPDAMSDARHNAISWLADQYNVDYYNLNLTEHYNAIGATLPKENVVEHGNIWGAIKLTQYVGKILQSTYKVPSVSDMQWESTDSYYQHLLRNANFPYINNFEDYLTELATDDNYVTLISVKDDGFRFVSDEQIDLLEQLGLYAPFKDLFRNSYAAVIDPQKGNVEQYSDSENVTISGSILDSAGFYSITSGGYNSGLACSITVDGKEVAVGYVGINLVVFDRTTEEIVDAVSFFWNDDGSMGAMRP